MDISALSSLVDSTTMADRVNEGNTNTRPSSSSDSPTRNPAPTDHTADLDNDGNTNTSSSSFGSDSLTRISTPILRHASSFGPDHTASYTPVTPENSRQRANTWIGGLEPWRQKCSIWDPHDKKKYRNLQNWIYPDENIPHRSELYLLGPGEKKVTVEADARTSLS